MFSAERRLPCRFRDELNEDKVPFMEYDEMCLGPTRDSIFAGLVAHTVPKNTCQEQREFDQCPRGFGENVNSHLSVGRVQRSSQQNPKT